MTPEQALVLLENLKREAPEKLVAASNTIALEAARWAQEAIVRDRKIYAEVKEIKRILMAAAPEAEAPAEAPAAAAPAATTNGFHAVDPDTLKGEDLERYMDTMLANEPPNANAPAPRKPFGGQAAETPSNDEPLVAAEEVPAEPASKPEGVVVVPAAAAKAKVRAQQQQNTAPKA